MATNHSTGKLHILVVDDDDIVLFLHDLMIKESGLSSDPKIFSSAQSALMYLKEYYSETDTYLIFLDINMPVMNGWQFLDAIGEMNYQITVVIVSSSIDSADYQKAKSYTLVKEYATKPLSVDACIKIKESFVLNDLQ